MIVVDCQSVYSPTRQTNPRRLCMQSRRSGSCYVNIESVRLFRRFAGGMNRKNVVCCAVE